MSTNSLQTSYPIIQTSQPANQYTDQNNQVGRQINQVGQKTEQVVDVSAYTTRTWFQVNKIPIGISSGVGFIIGILLTILCIVGIKSLGYKIPKFISNS